MGDLRRHFMDILNSGHGEPPVQDFLERNPHIIVGTDWVDPRIVITKMPLGAEHVTDFCYVNPTSGVTYLNLIEIEDPAKSIFTQDDEFTSKFTRAHQQLLDWLVWCQNHHDTVRDMFSIASKGIGSRVSMFAARGLLVYGRRSEINNVRRQERWSSFVDNSKYISVRTYDGFCEDRSIAFGLKGSVFDAKCVAYQKRDLKTKYE